MPHPERKKIRLPNYDYSQPGAYFVTTCVKNRQCVFGNIHNGQMQLNEYGKIVQEQWEWLHQQYPYLQMDAFVVMPNHFHAILIIVGNGRNHSQQYDTVRNVVGNGRDRSLQCKIKPVPELMGAFKTRSSKFIHQLGFADFQWQKSYYDHIIRNEHSLNRIRQYIVDNPQKWELDIENTNATEYEIVHHYQKLCEE